MHNGLGHLVSTPSLRHSSDELLPEQHCQSNSTESLPSRQIHHLIENQHNRSLHLIDCQYGSARVISSLPNFEDSMTEIVMDDVPGESEPTSAILSYCKRKFLRPYMAILTLVGLNPISTESTQCRAYLSYLHALVVLLVMCLGYFLQFLALYRGDRGFYVTRWKTYNATNAYESSSMNWGEMLFSYVIPNGLHFVGFISAVFVFKVADNEQLQNLIERVFLMSTSPKHLCRVLWIYVTIGLGFLVLLYGYVVPFVFRRFQIIQIELVPLNLHEYHTTIKITFLCTVFVQDLVEIVILMSYTIECYLLRVHLHTLSQKLVMRSIESLDWMREILEFHKLLDHLNNRLSIPVCFFTVMNLAYALAGIVFLFKDMDYQYTELEFIILNIMNVVLWLLIGLVPFFTAASVTQVCQSSQVIGHQIRIRPFVYHNTSSDDLNSTLLFSSSLYMSAKLFRMPIQSNYLCFAILVISVVILTLGMCMNFALGGF